MRSVKRECIATKIQNLQQSKVVQMRHTFRFLSTAPFIHAEAKKCQIGSPNNILRTLLIFPFLAFKNIVTYKDRTLGSQNFPYNYIYFVRRFLTSFDARRTSFFVEKVSDGKK